MVIWARELRTIGRSIQSTDWETCWWQYFLLRQIIYWKTYRNNERSAFQTKLLQFDQKEPPWLTKEIIKKINERKRAYHKEKRTQLDRHWNKFKRIRNDTVTLIRKSKETHYTTVSDKLNNNETTSKKLVEYLKSFHVSIRKPLYNTTEK